MGQMIERRDTRDKVADERGREGGRQSRERGEKWPEHFTAHSQQCNQGLNKHAVIDCK